MHQGLEHIHKRRKGYSGFSAYPHHNPWKRFIDRLVFVAGILGPVLTLPQLYNIWIKQETAGVSLFSWTAYLVMAIVWLVYGLVHKDKPIIVCYALWVLIEGLVVIGLLIY